MTHFQRQRMLQDAVRLLDLRASVDPVIPELENLLNGAAGRNFLEAIPKPCLASCWLGTVIEHLELVAVVDLD